MAMACLRLVTRFPERPLLSFPCFISCMARSTFALAVLLYLGMLASLARGYAPGDRESLGKAARPGNAPDNAVRPDLRLPGIGQVLQAFIAGADRADTCAKPQCGHCSQGAARMVIIIALVIHGLGMAIIVSTMLGGNRSRSDLSE